MASLHHFTVSLIYYALIISLLTSNALSDTIATNTSYHYENQEIHCSPNEPCNILCQHIDSCRSSQIYCPSNYPCDITCNHNTACASAIIHAQHSSSFRLLDCAMGSFTCQGLTIYFPPNDNGKPKAKIIGADRGLSAGETLSLPLQFYAINGWKDINISTSNEFSFQYHSGVMHCTQNLQMHCDFDSNAWQCANASDICNDVPTFIPTLSPSPSPIQNTQIEESENILSTQREPVISSTVLYVIIAMLLVFLCCFGSILLYYMYYSQSYARKLAQSHRVSALRIQSKGFKNIHSMSTKSSFHSPVTHSAMNSTPASNDSVITPRPSVPSPNMATHMYHSTEMMPINARNADSEMEQIQNVSIPHSYTQNKILTPNTVQIEERYLRQLMAAQQQIPIVYTLPQMSFPSQTHSSTNGQQILYQQPSHAHMLQMMNIMNQSQPPSLSSFMNGNGNGNAQPIPPSISNTPNNSSIRLQPNNDDYLKVRPPESVMSGLTCVTATTEPSEHSRSSYVLQTPGNMETNIDCSGI